MNFPKITITTLVVVFSRHRYAKWHEEYHREYDIAPWAFDGDQ